jgi:hypothetical protein
MQILDAIELSNLKSYNLEMDMFFSIRIHPGLYENSEYMSTNEFKWTLVNFAYCKIIRLIWIGNKKSDHDCPFSWLPKEIIKEITALIV